MLHLSHEVILVLRNGQVLLHLIVQLVGRGCGHSVSGEWTCKALVEVIFIDCLFTLLLRLICFVVPVVKLPIRCQVVQLKWRAFD